MTAYCPALDGLRGVAALSILFYHLGHWLGLPFIASNSYLAVDTFFCLGGYVVPLAYSANRAPRLTILTFVQVRLIRLLPLIVLATLISALYVLIRLTLKHQDGHLGELALATMFGFATIPYFSASNVVGGPQLFPLNGPQYTLFFELFINVVWFAVRKRSPWLVVFPFI